MIDLRYHDNIMMNNIEICSEKMEPYYKMIGYIVVGRRRNISEGLDVAAGRGGGESIT